MSRFPPHQNRHSYYSQTLLSFISSTPVSFHLRDEPLLVINLWDLRHWPHQTGCSGRDKIPNTVVTLTTWVTAPSPSTAQKKLQRKLREISNSALMWLAKSLLPKLLLSRIASSNLHLKKTQIHYQKLLNKLFHHSHKTNLDFSKLNSTKNDLKRFLINKFTDGGNHTGNGWNVLGIGGLSW